jgi:hypothetical protein
MLQQAVGRCPWASLLATSAVSIEMMILTCYLSSAGVSSAELIGCPNQELVRPLEEVDQSLITMPRFSDGDECLRLEDLELSGIRSQERPELIGDNLLRSLSQLNLLEQELCVNFPR